MQCDARIVVAKGFDGEQECSCRRTFFRFSKGMTTPLETLPNSSTLNSSPQSEQITQITQNTDGLSLTTMYSGMLGFEKDEGVGVGVREEDDEEFFDVAEELPEFQVAVDVVEALLDAKLCGPHGSIEVFFVRLLNGSWQPPPKGGGGGEGLSVSFAVECENHNPEDVEALAREKEIEDLVAALLAEVATCVSSVYADIPHGDLVAMVKRVLVGSPGGRRCIALVVDALQEAHLFSALLNQAPSKPSSKAHPKAHPKGSGKGKEVVDEVVDEDGEVDDNGDDLVKTWRKFRRLRRAQKREDLETLRSLRQRGIGASEKGYTMHAVDEASPVYQSLRKLFHECDYELTGLEEIRNPLLLYKYRLAREMMLASHMDDVPAFDVNERALLHATRAQEDVICSQGLDQRLCNSGSNFGQAIYASDDPRKCNQYGGVGPSGPFIFVCLVLLGKSEMRANSLQTSLKREPKGYDSVQGRVASCGGWNEFAVYESARVLPRFVARYSNSSISARFPSGDSIKLFPGELLSQMLPSMIALEFGGTSMSTSIRSPLFSPVTPDHLGMASRCAFPIEDDEPGLPYRVLGDGEEIAAAIATHSPPVAGADSAVSEGAPPPTAPTYLSTDNEVFSKGASEMCVLCLHSLVDDTSAAARVASLTECGHVFHLPCLMLRPSFGRGWITCPLCESVSGTVTGEQPFGGSISVENADSDDAAGTISFSIAFPHSVQGVHDPLPGASLPPAEFRLSFTLPPKEDESVDVESAVSRLLVAFERRLVFVVGISPTTHDFAIVPSRLFSPLCSLPPGGHPPTLAHLVVVCEQLYSSP